MTVPWGFIATSRGLTATTTSKQRHARAALGEFAIALFGRLGVGEEALERITVSVDPMEALRKLQSGEAPVEVSVDTEVSADAEKPAESEKPYDPDFDDSSRESRELFKGVL